MNNNRREIQQRREKVLTLLAKGTMKRYEIAKELGVDPATVSTDIGYLVSQSQNYLSSLAKETLPFMFQISIDGIQEVIKECWTIYQSTSSNINMYQRLAALKLIKECNESVLMKALQSCI
jgi:hypothetical protein